MIFKPSLIPNFLTSSSGVVVYSGYGMHHSKVNEVPHTTLDEEDENK